MSYIYKVSCGRKLLTPFKELFPLKCLLSLVKGNVSITRTTSVKLTEMCLLINIFLKEFLEKNIKYSVVIIFLKEKEHFVSVYL